MCFVKRGVFYRNELHFPSFPVKIDLISSIGYTIQKSGHMVLKGVIWVPMQTSGHMVLKEVIGYNMQNKK